jgi:circadian clock protein KaiB
MPMSGTAQEHTGAKAEERYSLRLYVTGATPASSRAIAFIKDFCEQFLKGRYLLEVVDVYQQPALADEERILATPTLVRRSPGPLRRIVGNLSDPRRLQTVLGIIL